jgi:hypothetical protein
MGSSITVTCDFCKKVTVPILEGTIPTGPNMYQILVVNRSRSGPEGIVLHRDICMDCLNVLNNHILTLTKETPA